MQKSQEIQTKIYNCIICNYKCSKNSDYNKHLSTAKHLGNINGNEKVADEGLKCKLCNKLYKSKKGLWGHKKICTYEKNENIVIEKNENIVIENNEFKLLTNLVLEVVKSNTELQKQYFDIQKQSQDIQKENQTIQKENQELQKQMIDVCKNSQPSTIISNSHNKTFNLQVFLNEKCKDAMNLSDFVKSFKLQLSDLEMVGDEGFINGMTKVIVAKLNGMDENTRPFHCTDLKRETIYVKEDDVWVREGPDNSKLAAAIKAIGHQNFFILKEYKALHPDCESTYSEYNDHYMNLIMKSAGCQKEDIAKVIKKLVKEIVILK
jgi:hypothetical protein